MRIGALFHDRETSSPEDSGGLSVYASVRAAERREPKALRDNRLHVERDRINRPASRIYETLADCAQEEPIFVRV
jgi:hypothetical protein